jgi:chemotaxis signal transduction protein
MQTEQTDHFLSQSQLEEVATRYTEAEEKAVMSQQEWVVFELGDELFTLSMNELDEISSMQGGIAVKAINRHVLGLISIRGEPVILVDMGQTLGVRPAIEPNDLQRVLVLRNNEGESAGFLVDRIIKVTDFNNWQQADSARHHYHSEFIKAITEYQGRGVSQLCSDALLAGLNH